MSDHTAVLRASIKARLDQYPALNLHLVSAHCNGAGLTLSESDALDEHDHEHTGPGTIRNHDRADLFWDADKVAGVIIECADEYDDPDEVAAEVETMMRRPDRIIRMTSTEHSHGAADNQMWTLCPDGEACRVYPRIVDALHTVHPDGTAETEWATLATEEDHITRGMATALSALTYAIAVAVDPKQPRPALAALLSDAQDRLSNSITLVGPRLYPHLAPDTGETP